MYRNTMYIHTITSWLHSQWQSYIATKIKLWVWPSQQFSSRHRTSNKNNTEYRTSVQKLLCYTKNKENSEKKQTQKQFFTVTEVILYDIQVYWNPKFETINLIWFWTFFMRTDVIQTANTALQRYSDSKTILVIVPLQKFTITWQRSYYERSQ